MARPRNTTKLKKIRKSDLRKGVDVRNSFEYENFSFAEAVGDALVSEHPNYDLGTKEVWFLVGLIHKYFLDECSKSPQGQANTGSVIARYFTVVFQAMGPFIRTTHKDERTRQALLDMIEDEFGDMVRTLFEMSDYMDENNLPDFLKGLINTHSPGQKTSNQTTH